MSTVTKPSGRRRGQAGPSNVLAAVSDELAEIERQLRALRATVDATGAALVTEVEAIAEIVERPPSPGEQHVAALFEHCVFTDLIGQRLAATRESVARLRSMIGRNTVEKPTTTPFAGDRLGQADVDRLFA